jgi:hypothetical protein
LKWCALPNGSTTVTGIVQLTDSTSSTSTTTAATPNSVKTAYDLANGAIAKSTVTAKGDLIAATASSTVSALPIGTNGQFLSANSACTTGMQWCTISLACVPCSAFTAAGQLLAGTGTSTFTALNVGTNGQFLVADSTCTGGLKWTTECFINDSCYTAKGDILVGTAASTVTALTVGSNNQVLVADSACTGGLKWLTAQGSFLCGYTCSATPFNSAVGSGAGGAVTSSTNSTFIGNNAGKSVTSGSSNTALGTNSACSVSTGARNTGVGHNAIIVIGTGSDNTAVGAFSGQALSTGSSCNTVVGSCALYTNNTGGSNVAIGAGASQNGASGSNNVAVGTQTMQVNTSTGSVAVGFQAMLNNTAGVNVAIGSSALRANTTGTGNTAIGNSAGVSLTTGSCNTLVGSYGGTATLANNVVLSDGAGTIRFQANSTGAISFDGTNFGTSGQTLQSNGSAAVPTWVTPIWQNLGTLTLTSTTLTTLLSVAAATFRGVVINLSVSDVTGGKFHTDTLQVNHDGTTANVQVIGGAHIGTAPYTASAAVTAGNLVVSVTSASTNSTKYVGNYMTFAI